MISVRYWWIAKYDAADGKVPPELRLPPAFIGALCLPLCLFPFAWSSGRTHWMAPVVFSSIFSAGATLLFSPIINYIQDAYPDTAASALAGELNAGASTVIELTSILPSQ